MNMQNTQNNEEIENLNIQSNENLDNKDPIEIDQDIKINKKEDSNKNKSDFKDNKNKENLDSILKDLNSVNTENKHLIKTNENENISQENRTNYNLLKENAYQNENDNFNNVEMDIDHVEQKDNIELQ